MEADGSGGRDNTSDSGSGGIIDVSSMSSGFNAQSPHANGECHGRAFTRTACRERTLWSKGPRESDDKKNLGVPTRPCPSSVEKDWFTDDTSTGVFKCRHQMALIGFASSPSLHSCSSGAPYLV